jgi:hypothetical protein
MVALLGTLRARRRYGFQHVPPYRSNPPRFTSGVSRTRSGPTPRDGATVRRSSIGCAVPCCPSFQRHVRRSRANRLQSLNVLCRTEVTSSCIGLSVVQSVQHSPLNFVLSSGTSAERSTNTHPPLRQVVATPDASLTPPRTQSSATQRKPGKRNRLT